MAHFEKTINSKEIFAGRVLRVTLDQVELENGHTSSREVLHHHGGAAIVPMTEDGDIYMVRQFRYAFGRELLELPAGKLEAGENPLEAAQRELEEECGLTADHYEDLQPIYPSVGYDTEVIHMYLATGLHAAKAHPDADEFLDLCRYPLSELARMVEAGQLHDAKTVAAILKLQVRKLEGRL